MLSGPPTTEIAFVDVIKHHHQKQLLEETGVGVLLHLTAYSLWGEVGARAPDRASMEAGAKTEATEEWGLLVCSVDAQLAFWHNPEAPP